MSSPLWESNPRHQPYHGCALPTELRGRSRNETGSHLATKPADEHSGGTPESTPGVGAVERYPRAACVERDAEAGGRRRRRRRSAAIYNHEVLTATSTFDLVTRSLASRSTGSLPAPGRSRRSSRSTTMTCVGFGSLSPYKDRAAYSTTVEDSVYVDRQRGGGGVGTLLLSRLVEIAAVSGFHAVMARIEASGAALPRPPRQVRVRARRHRAPGRPQVQSLARRRRHATPAVAHHPCRRRVRSPRQQTDGAAEPNVVIDRYDQRPPGGSPAGHGSVPERPKGADCKSAGIAYGGSNPSRPTQSKISTGRSGQI